MAKDKVFFNAYHNFMIATPVLAILSLISVVFCGYLFTYILKLIYADVENEEDYLFSVTSSAETAYSKGVVLLCLVSFFAVMMLINFFRAVFMDPGFFEDPLQVERKIVLKHANMSEESLNKLAFKNPFRHKSKKKSNNGEENITIQEEDSDIDLVNKTSNAINRNKRESANNNNTQKTNCNNHNFNTQSKQSESLEFNKAILIKEAPSNFENDLLDDTSSRISQSNNELDESEDNNNLIEANPCEKIVNKKRIKNSSKDLSNMTQAFTADEKIIYKKLKFLCNFNELASSYPLTHQENVKLREKINKIMYEDNKRNTVNEKNNADDTPDDINNANYINKIDNKIMEKNNKDSNNNNPDNEKYENYSISVASDSEEKKNNYKTNDNGVICLDNKNNASKLKQDYSTSVAEITSIEKFDIFDHFKNQDLSKSMLCGTCLRKKIERSHHCRMCGKCVLKMDHHCPWLANCIGFRNYKYFLLVHFYGITACLIITFSYWEAIINYHYNEDTSLLMCWFTSYVYFCNFGLLGFLLWLFLVNWKLALKNATVIENADKERFPSTKSVNIYDLGTYNNFCAVFGENPLVWFLPFGANTKGSGLVYPTIYKPNLLNDTKLSD